MEKKNNFLGNNKNKPEVQELLKQYEHLDQSDDFIGSQFKTPKGHTITVVGWDGVRVDHKKKFNIHCSQCSKDLELWPVTRLRAIKNNICKGWIPCGCSKSPKWEEWQNEIRTLRECNKRGYIFHGWCGDYNNGDTFLDLENIIEKYRWSNMRLKDFLAGHGDPKSGRERTKIGVTKNINDQIKEIEGGDNFIYGTLFKKDLTKDDNYHIKYWCPKCSNDEYTKLELCSGWFSANISSLKNGKKSCRCAPNFRWTQSQREYTINKICSKENIKFLKWCGEYKGNKTYLLWVCKDGHKNKTQLDKFLHGRRCRTCRDLINNNNGYFPKRANEYPDYLYLPKFFFDGVDHFIKCGRSFMPEERFENLCYDSGADYLENLYLWDGTHQQVYDTEQKIKEVLYSENLNYFDKNEDKYFAGDSECYFNDKSVIDKIVKLVEDSPLTLVQDNTKG